jgi:hypothetical protein
MQEEVLIIDTNEYKEVLPEVRQVKNFYKVLSIDVGVIHLGISVSILNSDYTLKEIIWVDNIDITDYKHTKCLISQCKLYHTKTFSDWIDHMIEENKEYFDESDIIIIEKQPPAGFVVVEQLIFSKYRHKTTIVSPNSVHKYFNFFNLDYDKRKEFSVKIADRFLSEKLIEKSKRFDRRHDISDSICIMLYFINKKQEEYKKIQRRKEVEILTTDNKGLNVFQKLEMFRYRPM